MVPIRWRGGAEEVLHLLFGFAGRTNRAKVWLFSLGAFVAWTLIIVVAISAVAASDAARPNAAANSNVHLQGVLDAAFVPVLLTLLFAVVVFYCNLAVFAKRLHDRGRSAWWLLVFILGPGLISVGGRWLSIQDADVGIDLGDLCVLIAYGVALWGMVEFYLLPGTAGDNRFGPDPLAKPT
ncbi:MAG TPA: DUF805 domain-containing protein [Rhizomicrobium sp.]|jgi:uncharacterized membrane protein YhaH (DUF805 family)|nr:DUF805 domain-containing protein [Rhizomicrobium sp.]